MPQCTPVNGTDPLEKVVFNLSSRSNNAHAHPLTSSPHLFSCPARPRFAFTPLRVKTVFSAFKADAGSNANNKSGIYRYLPPWIRDALSLEFRDLFSVSVFIIAGPDRFGEPSNRNVKSCWRSSYDFSAQYSLFLFLVLLYSLPMLMVSRKCCTSSFLAADYLLYSKQWYLLAFSLLANRVLRKWRVMHDEFVLLEISTLWKFGNDLRVV